MQELHFAEWEFSIYFVGYCAEGDIPTDPKERTRWCFQQVCSFGHRFGRCYHLRYKFAHQEIHHSFVR